MVKNPWGPNSWPEQGWRTGQSRSPFQRTDR